MSLKPGKPRPSGSESRPEGSSKNSTARSHYVGEEEIGRGKKLGWRRERTYFDGCRNCRHNEILPCNQDWIASNTHVYFGLHLLVSLLGDLEVSLLHIRTLLRVERVSDGAENKDVQLDSLLPLLLLFFVLGLKCSLFISESSFWRTNKNQSSVKSSVDTL